MKKSVDTRQEPRSFSEERRIQTVHISGIATFILVAVWSLIGFLLDQPAIYIALFPTLIGTSLLFALIRLGSDLIGRAIWVGSMNVSILIGCFIIDEAGRIDLMFLASAIGPIMTFSIRRELPFVIGLGIMACGFWTTAWFLGANYFGTVVIGEDYATRFVAPTSMASTFVITALEVAYFANITLRYSNDLTKANDQLEDAAKTKSMFLATMSHEIRTPMNGVVGMVEVLEASKLTNEQRRMLGTIRESSFALLRIIDDILDMSRIEAGKLQLSPTTCNLATLFEDSLKTLAPVADQRRVAISLRLSPDIPETVTADPGRLRQIILNLVGNAIKFSGRPEGQGFGVVKLFVSRDEGDTLKIDVVDDGIGMSPELVLRLFQPFSQGDTDLSRNANGTGLGLAIVKQLIDRMSGSIEVDSVLDEGSHFTVRLPIVDAKGSLRDNSLGGLRVIGLASSDMHRSNWQTYIEAKGGTVDWVDNEEDLQERFRTAPPDAIALIGKLDETFQYDPGAVERFHAVHPYRRAVTISKDRLRSYGQVGPNQYNVECSPLLPSDFWRGFEVMSSNLGTEPSALKANSNVPPKPASQHSKTSALQILVAEDNPVNRAVIELQLQKLGHHPLLAEDGKQAFELWGKQPFDLVLTDCHMPMMDGFELTRRIREMEGSTPKTRIPIIAITANALGGEADKCFDAGMDDYLSKPVQMTELSRVLNEWAAKRKSA